MQQHDQDIYNTYSNQYSLLQLSCSKLNPFCKHGTMQFLRSQPTSIIATTAKGGFANRNPRSVIATIAKGGPFLALESSKNLHEMAFLAPLKLLEIGLMEVCDATKELPHQGIFNGSDVECLFRHLNRRVIWRLLRRDTKSNRHDIRRHQGCLSRQLDRQKWGVYSLLRRGSLQRESRLLSRWGISKSPASIKTQRKIYCGNFKPYCNDYSDLSALLGDVRILW